MVGHKGYPLHRSEDIHPFFIIGPDRSGNTLMRRVLEAHEDVHIPPESYVLGTGSWDGFLGRSSAGFGAIVF